MGPKLHTYPVIKTQGTVSLDFTTHSFQSYSKDFIPQEILFIASYRIYILRLLLLTLYISCTWKNNITWAIKIIYRHFTSVSSVQSLSRVQLFLTPWIAAPQASLSITNSRSSLRLTSIESVMPSSHLILCRPLLLLPPNPSQHQSLFQWVNSSHEVAKVLEFQL